MEKRIRNEKYYVKNDVIRELINCSWRVNPLERYNINDIVNKLEKIKIKIKLICSANICNC